MGTEFRTVALFLYKEPKVSVAPSVTSVCSKPDLFNLQYTPHFLNVHFNVVFLGVPRYSNSDFPLDFSRNI
jgi:hypothetical protein